MFSDNSLPAFGAGRSLKGALYLRGDPTPVKAALLRLYLLPVHPAVVHETGIKSDVTL
jgi:hypothetical protein